jgi:hypothetical protein
VQHGLTERRDARFISLAGFDDYCQTANELDYCQTTDEVFPYWLGHRKRRAKTTAMTAIATLSATPT